MSAIDDKCAECEGCVNCLGLDVTLTMSQYKALLNSYAHGVADGLKQATLELIKLEDEMNKAAGLSTARHRLDSLQAQARERLK